MRSWFWLSVILAGMNHWAWAVESGSNKSASDDTVPEEHFAIQEIPISSERKARLLEIAQELLHQEGGRINELNWVLPDSSNVHAMVYLPGQTCLLVRFVRGRYYLFGNVSPKTYSQFISSKSPGRFVHEVLSPMQYYVELEQPESIEAMDDAYEHWCQKIAARLQVQESIGNEPERE